MAEEVRFRAMAGKKETAYPYERVADAMEAKRIELGLTTDQAAEMAGMSDKWNWYKKRDHTSAFTLEQIGLFAAAIGAPRGWPFIEWAAAKWLENALGKKD